MKSFLVVILLATAGMLVYKTQRPQVSKLYGAPMNFSSPVEGVRCTRFVYKVDNSFGYSKYIEILSAAQQWVKASKGTLCVSLYTDSVAWYEYFTRATDNERVIYNAYGSIWHHAGLFMNPLCVNKRCLGIAFKSGDIYLSKPNYGDIYYVAIHELGHTFGLPHSPNIIDAMYPILKLNNITKNDKEVLICIANSTPPFSWSNNCRYRERDLVNKKPD